MANNLTEPHRLLARPLIVGEDDGLVVVDAVDCAYADRPVIGWQLGLKKRAGSGAGILALYNLAVHGRFALNL